MLKKILVGLGDLSYSKSATRLAIDLAIRHEATLTAVTLVDPSRYAAGPVPIGGGEAAKELREHRLQLTEEIVAQSIEHFQRVCDQAGVVYGVLRERGNPFECMVADARYHDLTICGLRNLFDHGVLEEPPSELIRLVEGGVRPLVAVTPEIVVVERILIAYGGSSESARTMKRFAQMNLWPQATFRLVTFERDQEAGGRHIDDAYAYLAGHGIEAETELVDGAAKDQLLAYATGWDADLIVMGTSARSYLMRKIFGETLMKVLSTAEIPLFLGQ